MFIIRSIKAKFECGSVCPWTHLASCFSASAQSSSSPMSTADTSIYGSQTVKPRPIRSMAVRRMVLWAGSLGLGGFSSRKVSALPASGRKTASQYCRVTWGLSWKWQEHVALLRSNIQQCYRTFYMTLSLSFFAGVNIIRTKRTARCDESV